MKISARNQLKGKVVEIVKGATTSHVRIDLLIFRSWWDKYHSGSRFRHGRRFLDCLGEDFRQSNCNVVWQNQMRHWN